MENEELTVNDILRSFSKEQKAALIFISEKVLKGQKRMKNGPEKDWLRGCLDSLVPIQEKVFYYIIGKVLKLKENEKGTPIRSIKAGDIYLGTVGTEATSFEDVTVPLGKTSKIYNPDSGEKSEL